MFNDFYRATLCVSAVFAVARLRLSVRPSRWCILSTRLKISSNFFLRPVAPSLYFLILGAPVGRKIHGNGKICDFRPKFPIISDTVRDRPMVAIERL